MIDLLNLVALALIVGGALFGAVCLVMILWEDWR